MRVAGSNTISIGGSFPYSLRVAPVSHSRNTSLDELDHSQLDRSQSVHVWNIHLHVWVIFIREMCVTIPVPDALGFDCF